MQQGLDFGMGSKRRSLWHGQQKALALAWAAKGVDFGMGSRRPWFWHGQHKALTWHGQ